MHDFHTSASVKKNSFCEVKERRGKRKRRRAWTHLQNLILTRRQEKGKKEKGGEKKGSNKTEGL